MKKQLLILPLALIAGSAMAMSTPNLYVQADLGYSHTTAKANANSIKGGDGLGRVAIGTATGQMRYAADYTHFGGADHTTHGTRVVNANEIPFIPAGTYGLESTTEIDAQSLGVSAYYDFASTGKLTPYVGARIGFNRLSVETDHELQQGFADYDLHDTAKHKNNIGGGVSVGASYRVMPTLAVDVGAEYNHLGKVEDYTVNQYGAKVGVRYQF